MPLTRSFTIQVNPVVLASILDHHLRRQQNQNRVIGTLLGVRSEDGSQVQIKDCFPVPHIEAEDQVEVDMEYHRNMFDLHQRVNPKEVIVGWYATGKELNTYSALIQDFYTREAAPFPAIHLTQDDDVSSESLGLKTYVSTPIGVSQKAENCIFLPVPCEVQYFDAERSGLDLLSTALPDPSRTASLVSDMDHLERSIHSLRDLLDRVALYVDNVIAGKEKQDGAMGRFLMDTVAAVPKVDAKELEDVFNRHLQDVLMVVYLANTVRTQLGLSSKLSLVKA